MHVIYIIRIRGCVLNDMVECQYLLLLFGMVLHFSGHGNSCGMMVHRCYGLKNVIAWCRYEKDLHVIFEDELGSLNRVKTLPFGQELNEKQWTV